MDNDSEEWDTCQSQRRVKPDVLNAFCHSIMIVIEADCDNDSDRGRLHACPSG